MVNKQILQLLKSNQIELQNHNYRVYNDHRLGIIASSHPYGLFAEVIKDGKEYHYCNGELHVIYEKEEEIWRTSISKDSLYCK